MIERARAKWEDEPKHPAHDQARSPGQTPERGVNRPTAQAGAAEGETEQQQPETLRLF